MYNRRNFLRLTSAAVVGGIMLGEGISIFGQKQDLFSIPKTVFSDTAFALNQQMFEPLVDSVFVFRGNDNTPIAMKLVEIETLDETKKYSSSILTESFTLIFEVQQNSVLEDQIYQVSHSALNNFSMFVSTVGKSGRRYQAVFNRIYI